MRRWQHILIWLVTVSLCGTVAVGNANFVPPDWWVTLVDANGTSLISGGAVKVTGGGGGGATQVEGRAANSAATVGNPVLIGGWDGTNTWTIKADASGRPNVVGAAAVGAAVAGSNPVLIGASDGTNAQFLLTESATRLNLRTCLFGAGNGPTAVLTAGGDLTSNALGSLVTTAEESCFNGASWDRQRSANAAANSAGTGLLGTGELVFDGTNWQTWGSIASGVAPAQNKIGAVTSCFFDGASTFNVPRTAGNVADNNAGSSMGATSPMVYNGATWDRMRAANSGVVNTSGQGLLAVGQMVFDGGNWQASRDAVAVGTAGVVGTGIPGVVLVGRAESGGTYRPILTTDQDGNNAARTLGVSAQGWNEATMDRWRNNTNVSLTTQTGVTIGFTSADQTNYNGGHIVVVMDMTNVGTGSVTLEIDGKDTISGKYYAILTGAAVVGNTTNPYSVGPGLPATANVSANAILPRTFRIKTTANNANATTYTIGYSINCN